MEVQIIKDKKNPILKRREISFKVKEKVTPPRIEVKAKLAALLNSKPELIVIERLDTVYGKQELIGTGCIYETEERLKQLAHQHLIARDAPKVKEGEAAPAAPPAAAPATKEAETKPKAEDKAKPKPEAKAEAKPKSEAKPEGKKEPEKK
ncbi:MAG: 30S ribosomal protein S24e [Candidatus Methanoperedens sp.]|nr:30S ribosomal protein S24e [Candidatus Methanoperedens sp.]